MREIEDLIKYHNECEYLDFKREEYSKETIHNLVKDVIAFANSNTTEDRYIIIGVHKKDGQTALFNIESKYDSANIQQKIHSSITPELDIEYFPYQYESHNLMVLKIKNPCQQPYMALKDMSITKNGKTDLVLRASDCWVRKGSYQVLANRDDFGRMYSRPSDDVNFDNYLKVYFPSTGNIEMALDVIKDIDFPSNRSARKIEGIIKKREGKFKGIANDVYFARGVINPFAVTRYEDRDTKTLKENLKNIKETYKQHDLHYLFEKRSHKFNVRLVNEHDRYLEDATIELRVPVFTGLLIADRIYDLDETSSDPFRIRIHQPASYEQLNYPEVKVMGDYYVIREEIGDVKHHIERDAFNVDVRIVVTKDVEVSDFEVKCFIWAKNNKSKIEKSLLVKLKR